MKKKDENMKRVIVSTVLIIIFLFVYSCATVKIEPFKRSVRDVDGDVKRIFEKNYIINEPRNVYIGEELIKVKDYHIISSISSVITNKMICLNNYNVEIGRPFFNSYSGSEGETYEIFGTTMKGGDKLYLIKLPILTKLIFGITEDGEWANFVAEEGGLIRRPSIINITPKSTKFEIVKLVEEHFDIAKEKGFINYEIVFTGTAADSMNFLYREYTAADLARPAFHQNLTYPINTEIIRFRQTRVKIHEVSSESIKYTVLEDGLME